MSAAQPLGVRSAATEAAPSRRPSRTPAAAPPAPRLTVVRAPAHARTRVPFVMTCMALLAGSLLGALVLNTSMAQGEYQRIELRGRLAASVEEQQRIATEIQQAESSGQLAVAAQALGMVPTSHGAYLRLADGAVLGDPVPAGAGE